MDTGVASLNGEEKRDPISLHPGPDLVSVIARAEIAGRPVWPLAEFRVPRLKRGLYRVEWGGYALTTTHEERINELHGREAFLRPQLGMALDHPSEESIRNLFAQPHAVGQARRLAAAVLHDVYGWPLQGRSGRPFSESVAHHLSYASVRGARDAVYGGRVLWSRLAAWPWWPLAHCRPNDQSLDQWLRTRLPDEWWTLPYVVANFEAWRDPTAFRAAQAAVRAQEWR